MNMHAKESNGSTDANPTTFLNRIKRLSLSKKKRPSITNIERKGSETNRQDSSCKHSSSRSHTHSKAKKLVYGKKAKKLLKHGRNVVVCGSGGVGKSCLVLRYLFDKFANEYDPTIEESFVSELKVDGKKMPIHLIDTAGQEEFCSFLEATFDLGEAFVIVFSTTDRETFVEAKDFLNRIERHFVANEHRPIVFVGNKLDLESKRKVGREEAMEFCNERGITYMETSAKTSDNVDEVFRTVARLLPSAKSPHHERGECTIM
eukprot:m.101025 g.101025  ORF g.101025 m.101025 type:complete len:261 (+) comp9055_c0_seq1:2798-3580(+)